MYNEIIKLRTKYLHVLRNLAKLDLVTKMNKRENVSGFKALKEEHFINNNQWELCFFFRVLYDLYNLCAHAVDEYALATGATKQSNGVTSSE